MESVIDFGDLLTGLQCLPEREKVILMALINALGVTQNGDKAKIERLVGQTIIAAGREKSIGLLSGKASPKIGPDVPAVSLKPFLSRAIR